MPCRAYRSTRRAIFALSSQLGGALLGAPPLPSLAPLEAEMWMLLSFGGLGWVDLEARGSKSLKAWVIEHGNAAGGGRESHMNYS